MEPSNQPVISPHDDQYPPQQLQELRVNIAKIVGQYFGKLLFVTLIFAIFLVFMVGTKFVTSDTAEKMALAASIQVAFGMFIGYVCVYIGLMMTWFGIEAAYSVKGAFGATNTKGELSLRSASPGLLFALGGIILIAVCLYKPIVYEANAPIYSGQIPTQPPENATPIPILPRPSSTEPATQP